MLDRNNKKLSNGDLLESYVDSILTIIRFISDSKGFEPVEGFGTVGLSEHCYRPDDWEVMSPERVSRINEQFSVSLK